MVDAAVVVVLGRTPITSGFLLASHVALVAALLGALACIMADWWVLACAPLVGCGVVWGLGAPAGRAHFAAMLAALYAWQHAAEVLFAWNSSAYDTLRFATTSPLMLLDAQPADALVSTSGGGDRLVADIPASGPAQLATAVLFLSSLVRFFHPDDRHSQHAARTTVSVAVTLSLAWRAICTPSLRDGIAALHLLCLALLRHTMFSFWGSPAVGTSANAAYLSRIVGVDFSDSPETHIPLHPRLMWFSEGYRVLVIVTAGLATPAPGPLFLTCAWMSDVFIRFSGTAHCIACRLAWTLCDRPAEAFTAEQCVSVWRALVEDDGAFESHIVERRGVATATSTPTASTIPSSTGRSSLPREIMHARASRQVQAGDTVLWMCEVGGTTLTGSLLSSFAGEFDTCSSHEDGLWHWRQAGAGTDAEAVFLRSGPAPARAGELEVCVVLSSCPLLAHSGAAVERAIESWVTRVGARDTFQPSAVVDAFFVVSEDDSKLLERKIAALNGWRGWSATTRHLHTPQSPSATALRQFLCDVVARTRSLARTAAVPSPGPSRGVGRSRDICMPCVIDENAVVVGVLDLAGSMDSAQAFVHALHDRHPDEFAFHERSPAASTRQSRELLVSPRFAEWTVPASLFPRRTARPRWFVAPLPANGAKVVPALDLLLILSRHHAPSASGAVTVIKEFTAMSRGLLGRGATDNEVGRRTHVVVSSLDTATREASFLKSLMTLDARLTAFRPNLSPDHAYSWVQSAGDADRTLSRLKDWWLAEAELMNELWYGGSRLRFCPERRCLFQGERERTRYEGSVQSLRQSVRSLQQSKLREAAWWCQDDGAQCTIQ